MKKLNAVSAFYLSSIMLSQRATRRYKTDADLTPEEKAAQDALLLKVRGTVDKQIEEVSKKLTTLEGKAADKAEFDKLKGEFDTLKAKKIELKEIEEFKTLAVEFAEVSLQVKALREKGTEAKGGKKITFEQAAMKALKENKDAIKKSIFTDKKPFEFEIKVASDTVTEDSTILDGDTAVSLTQNTGIYSAIRRRITRYLQFVSTGTIATRIAMWFEEVEAGTGKPLFVHEKASKPLADYKLVEKTEMVKKVAVRNKMSMEWMDDLPQFVSFLKNKMSKTMDIETEDKLFNGAGGSGSDEPLGATINAVAFTGGSLAGKVSKPNVADVVRGLVLQVEEALGIANGMFCHPGVLAQLDVMKTTEGLYIRPFWANGELVAGIKVISTMALDADEFVGGDLSVLNVLFREGLTVRIGENGDDFSENQKTIVMEQRLVQFISANDYAQVVKGTFTAAIEQLESGS